MKNWLVILCLIAYSKLYTQVHGPSNCTINEFSENIFTETEWDINDSLQFIPHYDVYCHWDTSEIHLFKLEKNIELSKLHLVYDECDYAHPHFGHVTSEFGHRKYRFHYGIDLKLEKGEAVHAAFEGMIRISKRSKTYGNVIVIRHPNGLETLYAHLSELKVKVNDYVQAGDIIGLGGNTGRSYGSHLHFELRYKGEAINPIHVIDFENCSLKDENLKISKKLFEETIDLKAAKFHYVRQGETLSHIARKYGTSVSKLCYYNKLKETSLLQIGQKLKVQ